jgi:hypothetical protein
VKYFPDHRLILENTQIIRSRTLPEGITGEVLVKEGEQVGAMDAIAWGTARSGYVIIDMALALNIDPEETTLLREIISVRVGQTIGEGEPLGTSEKRSYRRNMPVAPADAVVSLVDRGRVILQINPERIEVQARLAGTVLKVHAGWGATIEAYGTLMQCAWGNGQFNAASFAFEPGSNEDDSGADYQGLGALLGMDLSLSPYRGKAVILTRPLTAFDLEVVEAQEMGGIVAPVAPLDLREKAMRLKVPVILTEGFGNLPPTGYLYDMLYKQRVSQAVFDAIMPNYLNNARPEIIIPGGTARANTTLPNTDAPLDAGMLVRINRAPYFGQTGRIVDLPESPVQIENGLRVLSAQVRLQGGQTVLVPMANLEYLGEIQN